MAQIGIAIGIPFGGRLVHPKWALSFKTLDFPVNVTQAVIAVEGRDVTSARNLIVEEALKQNCKFLWFLDDDVVVPRQTVQALGYILNNYVDEGVMVSTGIYCTKTHVPEPVIYKDGISGAYWDWRVNDIFDVDGAGAGCMMINMEVFKKLEPPYFRYSEEYKTVDGEPILHALSEDLYFCKTVRDAGFRIKAHGAILCAHYDEKTNKFHTLPEDSLPVRRECEWQKAKMEEKQLEKV